MVKEVNGVELTVHCFSYELEIRKEAYKLTIMKGLGIKATLWAVTNGH